jgi:hypothetical protein
MQPTLLCGLTLVVFLPPGGDYRSGLVQRLEPLLVQAFVLNFPLKLSM